MAGLSSLRRTAHAWPWPVAVLVLFILTLILFVVILILLVLIKDNFLVLFGDHGFLLRRQYLCEALGHGRLQPRRKMDGKLGGGSIQMNISRLIKKNLHTTVSPITA